MHANTLKSFAHEIYVYSGLLIYSLNVIVHLLLSNNKALLLFLMLSEDLNVPWVCYVKLTR